MTKSFCFAKVFFAIVTLGSLTGCQVNDESSVAVQEKTKQGPQSKPVDERVVDLQVELTSIDRTIEREPEYKTEPGYALFVFGAKGTTKIWVVSDGDKLYVDHNGNLDLTDPEDALELESSRVLSAKYQDGDFPSTRIVSSDEAVDCELQIGYYKSNDEPTKQTVKVSKNGKAIQYAGWQEIFAKSPEEALVFHFGGKYFPKPLRTRELSLAKEDLEVHLAFYVQGHGDKATTRLSHSAIPADIIPVAEINWPTKDRDVPATTRVELVERC